MKRLDLVVGCNGAGKSTFVAFTLAPLLPASPFVNADEIAKQRWPADPAIHSYEAAEIAAKTRAHLLILGKSFIAETVFSHPSKLELIDEARTHDYTVVLHVLMIPEELAVQRVRCRVQAGGHDVPEGKIRQRYQRIWASSLRRSDVAITRACTTTARAPARASSPSSPTDTSSAKPPGPPGHPQN